MNKMLTAETIERIRGDLKLSHKEFCVQLMIPESDYHAYLQANNVRNFPPRSISLLRTLLLQMEQENLQQFQSRSISSTGLHFNNMKILQHLEKVSMLQSLDCRCVGPITIELHLSNICNHRCPACTFSIPERKDSSTGDFWKARFAIELIPGLIADMQALGVKGVVLSGGGEPLMHPGAEVVIREIHEAGIDVGLVTNGSVLHKDDHKTAMLRATIAKHCSWCRISADAGDQAGYEAMHGSAKAVDFDKLVAGIKALAREKQLTQSKMTLGMSYLITPANYRGLFKAVEIFGAIEGVDYLQVKPLEIPPLERGMQIDTIFWDKRIFDALMIVSAYEREGFSVYVSAYKYADLLRHEAEGLPFSKCWCHPFYPTICADGTVVVCCHMLDNVFDGNDVGNYGKITEENSLRQIWADTKRYEIGDGINVRTCPSNCKITEANKLLEQISNGSPHSSFIG